MTKLDGKLLQQLALLKAEGASASGTKHPLRVLIRYTGGLDVIQAHGFTLESVLPGNIAAGAVNSADLEQLEALDNVVYIEAEKFRTLHLKDSVPEINAPKVWTGNPAITGKGVVVGIVDTGIDIFHHSFINSDGTTRILFIWDQTLTPRGTEASPPDQDVAHNPLFPGGVEFTANDINAALKTPNVAFRHADVSRHGTHVAGTAAGNGSQSGNCSGANTYIGVAPNASLIIVKSLTDHKEYAIIPTQAPYTVTVANASRFQRNRQVDYYSQDDSLNLVNSNPGKGEYTVTTAGVYTFNAADAGAGVMIVYDYNKAQPAASASSVDIAKGVEYIFKRAKDAGMAAVVNLSLGGSDGAHDGTSNEETSLDANLTAQDGRAIVIAAGNEGDTNKHASGTIQANQAFSVPFIISPDDHQPDFIEIWYPGPGALSFSVTSPSGTTPVVAPGAPAVPQIVGSDRITISSSLNAANNKNQINLIITPIAPVVAPPAPGSTPPLPAITTGVWTINLQETAGSAVTFDAWIHDPHDDASPSFQNPDKTRTITIPATARNAIVVGAYNTSDSELAPFSSWGPTADGRLKPDICAPGMGIFAPKSGKRNLGCCCDCCYSFYIDDSGTSMAAPHVTGVAALMLQRNSTLSFRLVRNQIQVTGRSPDPITGPTLPNNNWGYGKVDAFGAVNSLSILNPLPNGGPKPLRIVSGGGRAGARTREDAVTIPLAAMWLTYQPTQERLESLSTLLHSDPVGQLLAGLVSTHFDEVYQLVYTNKRVASRWHRMQGPRMVSEMMRSVEEGRQLLLPAVIAGSPVSEGLAGMLAILLRYGSPLLKTDAIRYRSLFLALPGKSIRELSQLQQPWIENGNANRHSRTHCA